MSRLIKYKLGLVCRVINGKAYKQEELLEYGKYKVLRVGNFFSNNNWYYSNLELEEDKYCNKEDLLFAWSASFGPRIWNEDNTIYHYHIWKLVPNNKIVNKKYLYYLLQNKTKSMLNSTHWSIMLHLTKEYMEDQIINIPENIYEQQKIASILSNLDSKIELNNKMNSELEKMAKTLYDYWFIQFDFPDENWKPYKSSGWKMIWSDELKREIPEGWGVKKLKELLKKNNQKFTLNWEKYDIDTIDLSVMPSWSMCLNDKSSSDKFWTNLFKLNKYDILFWWIRPYLLKAWFSPFDWFVTWTVHSFRVKNEYDYNFALITMISDSIFNFAVVNSKWTKMPVIWVDDLLEYKVAYNETIVKKYNEILYLKEIISKNILENQKLAELRDWLLPMLMNWQVSVK